MSPFEAKISGAVLSAPRDLPAEAFTAEVGAKAARNSAKLKRSFASMLGPVKREAAPASIDSAGVKSPPGAAPHHQVQQVAEGVKSKPPHPARSTAIETYAKAAGDSEGRVDNSGEQELPSDLAADRRVESAEVSPNTDDAVGIIPAWIGQPLPIEEAAPINFGVGEMQSESAPVEAEAMALAITAEASSTSGGESAGTSLQAMPGVVSRSEAGREAALPAARAAEQSPATQTSATPTRQSEGAQLTSGNGAGGNADEKRTLPPDQDAAGTFKLPAGLNAVAAQPVPILAAAGLNAVAAQLVPVLAAAGLNAVAAQPAPVLAAAGLNAVAAQPALVLAAAELPRSFRAEKTAAQSSAASAKGGESAVPSIFNNIVKITNELVVKANDVVGSVSAKVDANMFSPLLDFSAGSASDAPGTEAVTRVNLVQVVDELAAITETVRISGQQRCVVDLDVAGHGKLRVEVVRRADQVETVLSTDSAFLRESLQAAFDRSDRPSSFSSSFQWQGSPDTSGRGQNGAQADADARQNMYSKAEPAARLGRAPSLSSSPVAPVGAPVLAANHRLQIFA